MMMMMMIIIIIMMMIIVIITIQYNSILKYAQWHASTTARCTLTELLQSKHNTNYTNKQTHKTQATKLNSVALVRERTIPKHKQLNNKSLYIFIYLLTHLPTYPPTPWSRVLLEKLAGLQLVKKFLVFYGTRRFFTAFTSARHLSLS
jgi:hypothetical protein